MKITSSIYVKSFVTIQDFDIPVLPAVAFIGRSNVGKSTLINRLLNRKKLVKTSSTPGKTRLINVFLINNVFYFIDLPGYGFANVPRNIKATWKKMIQDFVSHCPDLRLIVQLVDIRHKPSKNDIEFQSIIKSTELSCLVVANKSDKVRKNQLSKSVTTISEILTPRKTPVIHSALKRTGQPEIWSEIEPFLNLSGL